MATTTNPLLPDGPFSEQPSPIVSDSGILGESAKTAISSLYARRLQHQIDAERVRANAKARKADLYWNGKQYLAPVLDGGITVGYRPIEEDPRYRNQDQFVRDYVVNRYRDKGRKFCSVLGGKAPSLKALPLREDDDRATQIAKRCDLLALDFHRRWDRDSKHLDLAYFTFKYETPWLYTPYVVNGREYGFSRVKEVVDKEVETIGPDGLPEITVEQQSEEREFENGYVECHVVPSTMAFTARGIRDIKRAPFFVYQYEEYGAVLLGDYPEWEDVIVDEMGKAPMGPGSDDSRLLRDQISSPTDHEYHDQDDRITVTHLWIAPGMIRLIDDVEVKGFFSQHFGRGAKITFLNATPVHVTEEFLADVWTPCKPEVSDTLQCDGIGYDFLQIQDIINDGANQLMEVMERMASIIIADPNVLNIESLTNAPSMPGQILSATPGSGPMLKQGITEVKGPELNPEIGNIVDSFENWGSEIIGITEQIYGGGEGVQTAEEARIRATQALRQLGITWKNMRTAWAQAVQKAVQQFARFHPDAIRISGELIDPEELIDAEIRFEAQESMPQSFGEFRESLREWIGMGPDIWGLFNLDDPENAAELDQYLGLPNWKWKGVDAINAIKSIISQLKESEPLIDPMTQSPAPSIQVDFRVFDPGLVATTVRGWAVSPMGRSISETNPQGYENVVALLTAAEQFIQQQQMAQMQSQAGPPQGGGAPMAPPPSGPSPEMGMVDPVQMNPPIDPLAADPNAMPIPPEMLGDAALPPGEMGEALLA